MMTTDALLLPHEIGLGKDREVKILLADRGGPGKTQTALKFGCAGAPVKARERSAFVKVVMPMIK